MITGSTQLLGVIGDPIAHSDSPLIHNAMLSLHGIDMVYLPFHVKPEKLQETIQTLKSHPFPLIETIYHLTSRLESKYG